MTTMQPLPGIRIRRLRLVGISRTYNVDFTHDQRVRDLSVVAGAFSSGKTAVLEFIAYGLGAKRHPRHPEVLRKVRSCLLEVELSGEPHVIERPVGEPSKVAYVRRGRLDQPVLAKPESRPIEPAGAPESLSALLLGHCKLEGVQLREAPSSRESRTDPLSFRDLMALAFLPNERIASMNFLFENEFMKKHKLKQVVDVVFGVHDDRAVELGQRIKELGARRTQARSELAAARVFVEEQDVPTVGALVAQQYEGELLELTQQLEALDQAAQAGTAFAGRLRREHQQAAERARHAAGLVRDCETQLARMMPLRAQYADDLVKLNMRAEAQRLFDPLSVTTCPACLHRLPAPPSAENGHCSLCSHELPHEDGHLTLGAADAERSPDEGADEPAARIRAR
ncbi:hypothetical protein ACFYYS_18020 [Streptomyces sp. NPDC002120]|uniref:hypothetical protein n=1 Tax=Streptomyces sp. NPDC002120 TaxID=3364631 RepID=UPI0036C7180D